MSSNITDPPSSWQLLTNQVLAINSATWRIQNIPSGFKFLMIIIDGFVVTNGFTIGLRFNNDAGNNYNFGYMQQIAGIQTAGAASASTYITIIPVASSTNPSIATIIIRNFLGSEGKQKIFNSNGGGLSSSSVAAGYWNNTVDEINEIDLTAQAADQIKAGSEVIIYGSY
jgi:hypothetical protein